MLSHTTTRLSTILLVILAGLSTALAAQGLEPEAVFRVQLAADREPVIEGEPLRLAVVVEIEGGWHINSDRPGDEFSLPTTVEWRLPDGWPQPQVEFPEGQSLEFDFSQTPIAVWEGRVVLIASLTVPEGASGSSVLLVTVTAQACNNTQCLPPVPAKARTEVLVAPAGSDQRSVHADLFRGAGDGRPGDSPTAEAGGVNGGPGLAGMSLPLLIVTVFLAGLALNLTPCVYPLIPITIGFFAQQAKERAGGTFGLALVYVLGMSVTYSVLGVVAALTGQLFGVALQSPWVVAGIVAVLLALAASMFGLWELRVPGWAMRMSGGRSGVLGALLMGLVVGFVAAPCIGPFVLGLLTFVGQQGSPVLGFVLFFTLAMGLGLPYLLLGTFTGAVNKLPTSGMWMVGVRKVFGVLLVALAAYFVRPLLPASTGELLMGLALILGGLYLLVVERTGHEHAAIDRVMRLFAAALVVAGVLYLPTGASPESGHLEWSRYDPEATRAAVASGQPVVIDFYADWCAPCRELDEKTFSDPRVADVLAGFARFKVDQTKANAVGDAAVAEYRVRGMPTVIVFRDGAEAFRITGFEKPERFLERLNQEVNGE